LALSIPAQDGIMHGSQPGGPVGVVERNTVTDLLNVCAGMKVISVGELPAKFLGKQRSYASLACPDNAHEDQDQINSFRETPAYR
jgi:hypothetical protein